MPPAVRQEAETQSPAAPHERPWLFSFLIAPDAVISLGLASGALTFLLRNEGVTPERAASIAALIALPHAIYFFWGPITDFWMRRRIWLLPQPRRCWPHFTSRRLPRRGRCDCCFLARASVWLWRLLAAA